MTLKTVLSRLPSADSAPPPYASMHLAFDVRKLTLRVSLMEQAMITLFSSEKANACHAAVNRGCARII